MPLRPKDSAGSFAIALSWSTPVPGYVPTISLALALLLGWCIGSPLGAAAAAAAGAIELVAVLHHSKSLSAVRPCAVTIRCAESTMQHAPCVSYVFSEKITLILAQTQKTSVTTVVTLSNCESRSGGTVVDTLNTAVRFTLPLPSLAASNDCRFSGGNPQPIPFANRLYIPGV